MDYEHMFLTAAIAASVAFAAPTAKAEAAPDGLAARAWAAAEQGPDALRRYVWRTRMIYALNMTDFTLPDGDRTGPGETDGFWTGVPGEDAQTGAWIEAAGDPPPPADPDPHRE